MRPPFWLWPNLLSLDAPLVAVLWQTLFLRCLGAPVRVLPALLLFLTVWLIYVADRLLDARDSHAISSRHQFYRRNLRAVFQLWCGVAAATVVVVWAGLPAPLLERGFAMLAAVLVYLLSVHGLASGPRKPGAKEAAVAALFALGTSLPAWGWIRTRSDALTVVLFSALCWLNCVAIEEWETQWETEPRGWPVAAIGSVAGILGLIVLHRDRPILASAEAASLFALVFLHLVRTRFSRDALRVLADAALLTPILFLPIIR